jgi:ERCC4-type nuclease
MDHQWKIVILMDHREFLHSKNEFAPRAQAKINNHFKGKHPIDSINPTYCERCHVISGDYMFVARKFNQAGEVIDERVLDLVVERKSVDDLQGCLIKKSKTCAPLSFFEAQMYKLQQTPGINRIFLMEGDEDKHGENGISRVGNPGEWVLRRKRVKTMRNQIRGDEWKGVRLVCTEDKNHSVQYLVDRMAEFMKEGFDPTKLHLYRTMEEYKAIVNERMKDSTFLEYLRLRKMKGTGDVTAMKEIRNPDGPWDKDFISPACIARDKKYKSNLEDRAEYYVSNNIGKSIFTCSLVEYS